MQPILKSATRRNLLPPIMLAFTAGLPMYGQVAVTNPQPPSSPCIGHEIHFVNQTGKTATVTYTHQRNAETPTRLVITLAPHQDRNMGCWQERAGTGGVNQNQLTIVKVDYH
jgi:hypothetical protein